MSELLLKSIVEKLQRLETQMSKPDDATEPEIKPDALIQQFESLQANIKVLMNKHDVHQDYLVELISKVEVINRPIRSKIEYKHRLHKGIWIAVACFILSVLLMIAWINALTSKDQYEANDIKYRSLKVFGSRELMKVLDQTDSMYSRDRDLFVERVEMKEQRLAEQANLLRLAGEKEKEAKELKKKAGKNNVP